MIHKNSSSLLAYCVYKNLSFLCQRWQCDSLYDNNKNEVQRKTHAASAIQSRHNRFNRVRASEHRTYKRLSLFFVYLFFCFAVASFVLLYNVFEWYVLLATASRLNNVRCVPSLPIYYSSTDGCSILESCLITYIHFSAQNSLWK